MQIAGERVKTPTCGNFLNFWVHLSARCAKWNVRKIHGIPRTRLIPAQESNQGYVCDRNKKPAAGEDPLYLFLRILMGVYLLALILGDFTRYNIPPS